MAKAKDVVYDVVVDGQVVRSYAPGCHPELSAKECATSYASKLGGQAVAQGGADTSADDEEEGDTKTGTDEAPEPKKKGK
jgi:hypothetical protein